MRFKVTALALSLLALPVFWVVQTPQPTSLIQCTKLPDGTQSCVVVPQ